MSSHGDLRVPLNDLRRIPDAALLEGAFRRVLESGRFIMGAEHDGFEAEFAAYCGVRHAVGVASGTDALELALRACGCTQGDEVVLAPNAGFYAASACLAIGAVPVFADVEPEHLTLSVDCAVQALSERTRAVVVTHLYGSMADVAGFAKSLAGSRVAVIEDCAQSHGAAIGGRRAGSLGDAAAFSFYPTKNLGGLGDGGALTTNGERIAQRARRLRQYGWSSRYVTDGEGGRNSRLDELQAAFLRERLRTLDAANHRRKAIARRYGEALRSGVKLVNRIDEGGVAHLCVVRHRDRAQLQRHLETHGIASAVHYPLLDPEQEALRAGYYRSLPLPVCQVAQREILTLPCFPAMTEEEIRHVAGALADFA
jgi:dTDP-4-amino-4,6-dideoxygalactose transaminase